MSATKFHTHTLWADSCENSERYSETCLWHLSKTRSIKAVKCLNNFNTRILRWLFSLCCKLEQSEASRPSKHQHFNPNIFLVTVQSSWTQCRRTQCIFSLTTSWCSVHHCKHFGERIASTLKMEELCSAETLLLFTRLHGVKTQKASICIFTAVRTSNLKSQ